MSALDPIQRAEFNAAMHGMRESIEGVKEAITRVEAKQDMASGQSLEFAREAGRTEARIEALERAQIEDRAKAEQRTLEVATAAEERAAGVAKAAEARSAAQDIKIWGLLLALLGLLAGLVKVAGH